MPLLPYKHKWGQRITTDVPKVACDRAFLSHFHIDAADAPAASSDGVHAAMNLGAAVQSIITGITNSAVPRNIRIDGNVVGIDGVVKIHGTNFADEVITEEITANGTDAKDGNLAFKTVTNQNRPADPGSYLRRRLRQSKLLMSVRYEEIKCCGNCNHLLGDDSGESVTVALDSTEHTTVALVAAAVVDALERK